MPDAAASSSVPPAQNSVLFDEVGKLIAQSGGVGGLVQQFEQKGLSGLISGWISSGPNPPIGGEQVLDLLGRNRILAMAAKAGLSEQQVTAGISQILPQVVDHLTPNGAVPPHVPGALDGALGMLKSRLFGA